MRTGWFAMRVWTAIDGPLRAPGGRDVGPQNPRAPPSLAQALRAASDV
jgi:hypothetical protein